MAQTQPVQDSPFKPIGDWLQSTLTNLFRPSDKTNQAPTPTPTPAVTHPNMAFYKDPTGTWVTGPRPTPTPGPPQPLTIKIPEISGGLYTVPQPQAGAIYNAFDKYGEATNAAQVLRHPTQVSGTKGEIQRGVNTGENRGENPSFRADAQNFNPDGSEDRGLFQINSNTFTGMMANPFWKQAMERRGITSYDDMFDPYKNAMMAMLILMRGNFNADEGTMNPNPSYQQWFAAPRELRVR